MTQHTHLSPEDVSTRVIESAGAESIEGVAGCALCENEAGSVRLLLGELRHVDASSHASTEWDDLLLRKRIREAVALERPHSKAVFGRFRFFKPALVTASVAILALVASNPLSQFASPGSAIVARSQTATLPSWAPLPDESEDEGLAVLAEWTPNAAELEVAGCHSACLFGLTSPEEDQILRSMAPPPSRARSGGPSPR